MKEVLVVGAGVIGATTALHLLQNGFTIRILTSEDAPVAGLNGVGIIERHNYKVNIISPDGLEEINSIAWENESFRKFQSFLESGYDWIDYKPVEYHWTNFSAESTLSPFPGMEVKDVPPLKDFSRATVSNAYLINTRSYHNYLLEKVKDHKNFLGIEYGEISAPAELEHDCKVICCGLGQRRWDSEIYPCLGETVLIDNKDTAREKVIGGLRPECSAVVFPIPGSASHFILGASKRDYLDLDSDYASWSSKIIDYALEVVPTIQGFKLLEERSACRPMRNGGVRIQTTLDKESLTIEAGGLGGSGWTLSWAIADKVYNHILKYQR